METRWHVPKDEDLCSIKIDDRKKELHATRSSWSRITDHLTRNDRIAQASAAEEAKKANLKAGSYAMTKNWPDSIENVRIGRDAKEAVVLDTQDDHILVKFLEVKKEQDAERKIYVDKMKEKMMQRKDYPKAITSAFLLSQCMYEREKQIEHKEKMKRFQEEEDAKYAQLVFRDAESVVHEEEDRKTKVKAKNQEYAKSLIKQIEQIQKDRETERIKEVEEQMVEQEHAYREAESIERRKIEKQQTAKRLANKAKKDFITFQRNERAKLVEEDEEYEKLSKIVQESRDKIEAMTKEREQDIINKKLAVASLIHSTSAEEKREADLKTIYEKGQAKMRETEETRLKVEQEKRSRMKAEIIKDHKDYIKRSEDKEKMKKELTKWELINRFKNLEQDLIFQEREKLVEQERRLQARQMLDSQKEYKEQQKAEEKAEMEEFERTRFVADDAYFFKYAEEVTKDLKDRKMSTYPVEKVIDQYKEHVQKILKPNRCTHARHMENCKHDLKELVCDKPGKMAHCPCKDPNYNQCKCVKDRIYK